jgi:hypothetical protein
MKKFVPLAAFVGGCCFLCFVAGAGLATFRLFPYRTIRMAHLGGKALVGMLPGRDRNRWTLAWHKDMSPGRGTVYHDPSRACNGYTLYTSAHAEEAWLIDMDGTVVHSWHLPYASIYEPSPQIPRRPSPRYTYWRKAEMLPNGDLLVLYVEAGVTPWGLGLVRIDRDSRMVWKFLKRVHHDFCLADDGRIFTLTHGIRTKKPKVENLQAPFLEDFLTILSPAGQELKSYSLYVGMGRSPFKRILEQGPPSEKGDYLHANALEILGQDKAAAFPFAKPGQVLVSFRHFSFIGFFDLDRQIFTWGTTGPFREQHDPDLLDNGTILLFDNRGRLGLPGGASRVIELNPVTHAIEWCYEGTEEAPFYSEVRCSQQPLPNGNVLITLSDAGRILEVTRDKQIVWDYYNPATGGPGGDRIAATCWATRTLRTGLDPAFAAYLDGKSAWEGGVAGAELPPDRPRNNPAAAPAANEGGTR